MRHSKYPIPNIQYQYPPMRELLILAMTRMKSGICTAGIIAQPHPQSVHAWVRPVKEFGTLLLADMTAADDQVVRVNDVIGLDLRHPRPDPVHAEDWVTDFVKQPPRILRRLEGEKRAAFFADHIDRRPDQVLLEHSRSLCIIQPTDFWCDFFWDRYSGKYRARIGYHLDDAFDRACDAPGGLDVTDLAWRALGREWLNQTSPSPPQSRQFLRLDKADLLKHLRAEQLYLSIGLSRRYQGSYPALIVGVHPVPDYSVEIDYTRL